MAGRHYPSHYPATEIADSGDQNSAARNRVAAEASNSIPASIHGKTHLHRALPRAYLIP
jgi:hypothetical protein